MANLNISFPFDGIDKGKATCNQSPTTSPDMNNVRPYDVLDSRARGGQRPGLDKRYSQQIGDATSPVVEICQITIID